jgi:L-lactate utilization protein LutB
VADVQTLLPHPREDTPAPGPAAPEGLETITNDILSCAQCGSCVSQCPVYGATRDETFTARETVIIKRALEKKTSNSPKFALYFCMHCGRCDEGVKST